MTKPLSGIRPITVGETLYQFTSHVLCLQFHDVFVTHFFPHQFGVTTKGGCETIIHGIWCTLNLHLNWVVLQLNVMNIFNLLSKGVIFQEFHALGEKIIQLIPFVRAFYEFESPLFYNHHNRASDITVIPSAMRTCQGDPLGRALFALAHFRALKFIASHFCFCLLPSIANDTHIIDPLPLYPLHMNIFRLNFM
jgi:hypothetical protein